MSAFPVDDRNRIRRKPQRGSYEREVVYAILDEALYCHVGFVEDGWPIVIPILHARQDDTLYLHGARASRLLKHVAAGHPVCVAATLLDGLVLARSVFHHSLNYRSAVVFGHGRPVEGAEKREALRLLTEHVARGRWDEARLPTPQEEEATAVVAIAIERASAKIRSGPPVDDEADYDRPIWAGVVPVVQAFLDPIPDPRLPADIPLPASLRDHRRRSRLP
ncbi:MAG: pyridoxamine 5'-phosphate oxidase family protein [Anaerolineae bacterium]|nr:pyridoxamine 5'-phosphate oxidase family protein [Caldilineales bacterium]MCX7852929.1 pyridoxamine 5'-phosphate oxidase family protein [Caldilineales bacterium]MDW8268469.1 pyridoxamine 5'-phosphate oxidase family protein [Anaerolineae bacterium]